MSTANLSHNGVSYSTESEVKDYVKEPRFPWQKFSRSATLAETLMPLLPTLADRVWFAYHCLPRDSKGTPPSYVSVERPWKLPNNTLSRIISSERKDLRGKTLGLIAKALNVKLEWLMNGGEDGPLPTGIVPPRPGTSWQRYRDLPDWDSVVETCRRMARPKCPPEAFDAAGDMPIYRPIDHVTPELAVAAAVYAWATSTPAEQRRYANRETEQIATAAKRGSSKQKAV